MSHIDAMQYTCPMCYHSHDISNRITGDVILCGCGANLRVQHGQPIILTAIQQATIWTELENETAALWFELFRSEPELSAHERRTRADLVYEDTCILISLLAYAREWDADVVALRQRVTV
jgi:hypothetical protein